MPGGSVPDVFENTDNRGVGSSVNPLRVQATVSHSDHDPDGQLVRTSAFKGRWGTHLVGNELLIPKEYEEALKWGGVITPGLDTQLLLFGKSHWERMERVIAQQLGDLDPDKTDIMRHLYGRAEIFKTTNKDEKGNPSITVSDELINYARLRKDATQGIVIVGLIFWAEIYDADLYSNHKLTAEDVRALAKALT